jgi:hypothetical protein
MKFFLKCSRLVNVKSNQIDATRRTGDIFKSYVANSQSCTCRLRHKLEEFEMTRKLNSKWEYMDCNYASFLSLQNVSNLVLGEGVGELNFGVFWLSIVRAIDINDNNIKFCQIEEN